MKSEHRHELKTNELAEWLSNLPQWTKENLITIICVSALVVVLAGVYLWRGYNRNTLQVRERTEFTNLVNQVAGAKIQVLDLPGLIKGASRGKGRGREVLSVVRSADLIGLWKSRASYSDFIFDHSGNGAHLRLYGNVEHFESDKGRAIVHARRHVFRAVRPLF